MRQLVLLLIVIASLLAGGCEGTRRPQSTVSEPPAPTVSEPPAPTVSEPPAPTVSLPPAVTVPITPPDAAPTDTISAGLLRYFAYARKLQTAELAKEQDATRQLYAAARTDFNRVRYAMALSIPGAALSDEARALEALDPLLKNQNSVLYGVAFMLNAVIQEQRRAGGLQQKLDALRSLEKDLLDRDGGKRK